MRSKVETDIDMYIGMVYDLLDLSLTLPTQLFKGMLGNRSNVLRKNAADLSSDFGTRILTGWCTMRFVSQCSGR